MSPDSTSDLTFSSIILLNRHILTLKIFYRFDVKWRSIEQFQLFLTNVVEYVMLNNSEMNQIHVTHHLWEVGHFALFWRVLFPLYEKKKKWTVVKISAVNDSIYLYLNKEGG